VLPLQNLSGNVQEEYFVDGMTDALITELAHTPNLRVVDARHRLPVYLTHQNVRGLHVAMDDRILVGVLHAVAYQDG
jgi:TolB-like protein